MDSVNDWNAVLKLELADAALASVAAEDGAFACTDAQLLYANAAGVQRAQLAQIAKVNREGSDIVISSADGVLIRGPVSTDQESLVAFFDAVKTATSKAKAVKPSSPVPVVSNPVVSNPVVSNPVVSNPVVSNPVVSNPVEAAPVSSFAMDTPATSSHSTFTPATSSFPEARTTSNLTSSVPAKPASSLQADAQAAGRPAARNPVAGASSDRLPLEYAGFWVRTVAFVIDSLIVYLAQTLLQVALGLQIPTNLEEIQQFSRLDSQVSTGWLLFTALAVLWQWLYYALMEASSKQGTLGKMAMGLAVTDLEGRKLSFARASGRFLGKGLANLLAGLVLLVASLGLVAGINPNASDPSTAFSAAAAMGVLGASLLAVLIVIASNVMAAFTKRKQALQDIVSGCVVLRKPSS
jgi:uncharacterized RDD family membrane protein YckC